MTHAVDVSLVIQLVSALLHTALGVWILTLTPRRLQTMLLAGFALAFGLGFGIEGILLAVHVFSSGLPHAIFYGASGIATAVLSLALAASVPHRVRDRRPVVQATVAGLALGVVYTLVGLGRFPPIEPINVFYGVTFGFLWTGLTWVALYLIPLRAHPSREPGRAALIQMGILAIGLGIYWTFNAGGGVVEVVPYLAAGEPLWVAFDGVIVVAYLLVPLLWGRNMLQAGEDSTRIHRTVMLALLATMLAGAVYEAAFGDAGAVRGVAGGVAVAVLAYGILRHDLAGLDEKVEFGVSRTTVAGVFVAVFFVVSEGAQVLLAGFAGSELLGVLAAGALVFVLAPIQRAADELAGAVVPDGDSVPAGRSRTEARYRSAVEAALADGEVTEAEERHLVEKAEELGLSPTRAYEIRREVEGEADQGGDAA